MEKNRKKFFKFSQETSNLQRYIFFNRYAPLDLGLGLNSLKGKRVVVEYNSLSHDQLYFKNKQENWNTKIIPVYKLPT